MGHCSQVCCPCDRILSSHRALQESAGWDDALQVVVCQIGNNLKPMAATSLYMAREPGFTMILNDT